MARRIDWTLDALQARSIVQPDGCWSWKGSINRYGYGRLTADRRDELAHRFAYKLFVGPIPTGQVIDHLCRNRACVNPDHLEVVSPRENTLRGTTTGAIAVATGACMRGHAYTVENTRWAGHNRTCRRCDAMRQRRYKERKLAA